MDPCTEYNAGSLGGHGNDYQRQLAWTLLQRAMLAGCEFRLAFEMDDAGKFDDVGLFVNGAWTLIQTKHSRLQKHITKETLFEGGDGDFALGKYLKSYRKMKWSHGEVGKIILFTNRSLDWSKFEVNSFLEVKLDGMLDFLQGKHLQLINQEENMMKLLRDEAFKRDLSDIREAIVDLFRNEKMHQILEEYHCYLKEVFVIDGQDVCLVKAKQHKNPIIKQLYSELVQILGKDYCKIDAKFMGNFWSQTENLVKTEIDRETIEDFFSKLVLSISQPNVEALREKMISEGRRWMLSWVRPDDLGRMDGSFDKVPLDIIMKEFDNYEKSEKVIIANGKKQIRKDFLDTQKGNEIMRKIKEKLLADIQIGSHRSCASFEQTEYYYINRQICFPDSSVKMLDTEFVQQLFASFKNQSCFVLTAQPGMGKSTLWQYLAFQAQQFHSDKAVLLVYLNNLSGVAPSIDTLEDISSSNVFKNELSNKNVQLLVNESKSEIILFLDAFDEVRTENRENTLKLIRVLLQKKNIKIIVCGRRHIKNYLVESLKAVSMELQAFDCDEQVMFLKKYWKKSATDPARFKTFADKIVAKFHRDISRKEYDFTGVPLMIRMVAEIFAGPFEKYLETKDGLNSIVRGEKMSLIGLYEQFGRKCIKITMNKKYNVDNNKEPDRLFDSTVTAIDYDYQVLAVERLFSFELIPFIANKKYHETLQSIRERIEDQQSLIIEVVATDVRFTHLSFAEYYAAKHLFEFCGLKEAHFCKRYIWRDLQRRKVVRIFFLAMIESNIVINSKDVGKSMAKLSQQDINRLKVLKECGTEVIYWACKSDFENIVKGLHYLHDPFTFENVRNGMGRPLLRISFESGARKVDEFLKEIFKQSATCKYPLHLAVESNRLDVVKQLIAGQMDVNLLDDEGNTPIFRVKSFEMIDYLLQKGANINVANQFQSTMLFNIVFYGEFDSLPFLFELKDSNGYELSKIINVPNDIGETLLHVACRTGNLKIVKLLIQKGADVNLKNKSSDTPLDLALKLFHLDVVKYLHHECNAVTNLFNAGMSDFLSNSAGKNCLIVQISENTVNCTCTDIAETVEAECTVKNAIRTCLFVNMDFNLRDNNGNSALHLVAKSGCIEAMKILCKNKVQINGQNIEGKTPLHFAVKNGSYHLVEFLVSQGSDLTLTDKTGNTVLHSAAKVCDEKMINTLIEMFRSQSLSLDTENFNGKSPLYIALNGCKETTVKLLLDAGANINSLSSLQFEYNFRLSQIIDLWKFSGTTFQCLLDKTNKCLLKDENLLRLAADLGCEKSVKILIEAGMNINAIFFIESLQPWLKNKPDSSTKTALHIAAQRGHNDVIKLLINSKADVNIQNGKGQSPLHFSPTPKTYNLLVREGANENVTDCNGNTVLHIAARDNRLELVEFLLNKKSSDVDCKNRIGQTAFHFASYGGHERIVELLIRKNANINVKDNLAKTAIFYAVKREHSSMIRCLKKHSAEIDLNDYKGMLHTAVRQYKTEQVVSLLMVGVDVNEVDEYDRTALHWAASLAHSEAVFHLVAAGANVNTLDKYGNYPLNYAAVCYNLREHMIGYLIDYSTNIDHRDNFGEPPLHSAIRSSHSDYLTNILIAKHASIYLVDLNGNTPLHQAISRNKDGVAHLLIDLLAPPELTSQNNRGEIPLHLAVRENKLALVVKLVEKGAYIEITQQKTALELARDKNYWDIYEYLRNKLELRYEVEPLKY
uniref:Ankyrin-1 n=1 Tax=Culex pipiens TaxID=7175 RepID=A0A8D8A120_CULPI